MKKNILFLLMLFLSCIKAGAQCDDEKFLDNCAALLDKFVFVKSFNIEQVKSKAGEGIEYSYVLSKGTSYLITICDQAENGNRLILELYDRNRKLIVSSYNKKDKKYYPKIAYPCAATGVYYLKYRFEGNKESCGVSILGFDKK